MNARFAALAVIFFSSATSLCVTGCDSLTRPPADEPIAQEPAQPQAKQAKNHDRDKPQDAPAASGSAAPVLPAADEKPMTQTDVTIGKGDAAKSGDMVVVNYVGTLTDGKEFDSSYKRKHPFVFRLGQGKVIKGWEQGIVGMKPGGKRKLVIPPSLGYGVQGAPPIIPPNATLNFDVELMEVHK